MKHTRIATMMAALVAVLVAAVGCAGGPWAGSYTDPSPGEYAARAGQATERDLYMELPRVLGRKGYLIEHAERRSRRIVLTTQWKIREPFAAEADAGVVLARTRLQIHATKRTRLYSVRVVAVRNVKTADGAWRPARVTHAFEEYAESIAREMRLAIASGMRTF